MKLPYPFFRWEKNSNEVYGYSAEDLQQQLNAKLAEIRLGKWLKLKYKKSWWWRLLHPRQARAVRMWLEHCREIIVETLKDEKFYEQFQKGLVDSMTTGTAIYGRSPAMSAIEDIVRLREIDATRRRWEEITEEITWGKS